MNIKDDIIGAKANAHLSEFSLAKVFGVISPKINIKTVITMVAIPTPPAPNIWVNTTVANEDDAMFTILLPTKIVVKALS